MPPVSLWEQYSVLGVFILGVVVIVGLFLRIMDKYTAWQSTETLRQQEFLQRLQDQQRVTLETITEQVKALTSAIIALGERLAAHDAKVNAFTDELRAETRRANGVGGREK